MLLRNPSVGRYQKGIVAPTCFSSPSYHQALRDLFPTFPDLLRNVAQPVLSALPNSPPVGIVHSLHSLFQHPVPPVLGHLSQPNRHFARPGFALGFLGLVEVCENVALLA